MRMEFLRRISARRGPCRQLQNARVLNGAAEGHVWHLHGHSFWIVGQGNGMFDSETDPDSLNLVNPVRRDSVALWPYGWTALRFKADNVGVWPFHCAMNAHSVMGMGLTFVTSPDMLALPPPHATNCLKTSLNVDDAEVCFPFDELPAGSAPSAAPGVSTIGGAGLVSALIVALIM